MFGSEPAFPGEVALEVQDADKSGEKVESSSDEEDHEVKKNDKKKTSKKK